MFKINSTTVSLILMLFLFIRIGNAQNSLLSIDSLEKIEGVTHLSELPDSSSEIIKVVLKRERLDQIPSQIFKYTNLQYLDLSKNRIDSISPDIAKLKNLQVLILSKNNIEALPYEFFSLTNLVIISLNSNGLNYISPNINKLTKLKSIDLWNTNVSSLPEEMSALENIEIIDLRGVTMNPVQQDAILELFPNARVYMSLPCNCGF